MKDETRLNPPQKDDSSELLASSGADTKPRGERIERAIEEAQTYAMRQAFLLLFSRLLYQQTDSQGVLTVTLEQAIEGLQAVGGDVWQQSGDEQLRLRISSFSTVLLNTWHYQKRIEIAQKVALSCKTYLTKLDDGDGYRSIGVPMLHHQQLMGILILYADDNQPFNDADRIFLEDFALLAAPAIALFETQKELLGHMERQQALLDMSRQVTDGLGLDDTLAHTLQWANRFCPMEMGWIGFFDQEKEALHSVHSFGFSNFDEQLIFLKDCPQIEKAIAVQQSQLLHIDEDENCISAYFLKWHPRIREMIVLPLVYRKSVLGVLGLANKFDGRITQNDVDALSIVGDISAIALNNAMLHARTVTLLNEREQMHKISIQRERLAVIGRLMRSLTHEINNPLQAVRGALALAQEDIESVDDLQVYFEIMERETKRVIRLLERMRNIYRESSDPDIVDLNQLVQNIVTVCQKELNWQHTQLKVKLAPIPPLVWGDTGQLHIALLNLLLGLSGLLAQSEHKTLRIKTHIGRKNAYVMMTVQESLENWTRFLSEKSPEDITEVGFGLQFSRELIESHSGRITIVNDRFDSVLVTLPRSKQEGHP